MSAEPRRSDVDRIARERDLYRRLLGLSLADEPEPLLREALALLVDLTEAKQGYLALHDDDDEDEPRWWIAHGLTADEIAGVRHLVSRGIIAEAIATGDTIVTPSALLDPRFNQRDSIQRSGIEAVLCTPIGADPPRGVLYLLGREGAPLFDDDDIAQVELVARHLGVLADRMLELRRCVGGLDPTAGVRASLRLDGVIGRSEALAALLKQIALVAPLDVTVLLTGDSGTGKSQLARLIHENGPRARHPFVEVNCAALPETLIESELFGAMPGAHSTAVRRMEGKVEAAARGTLFLDEIAELPPASQAKLLQLIQSGQYYPLGAARPSTADVRIIAATNVALEEAVAARRFREDLLYRLQVLPMRVPSLEERREDIGALATHFITASSERHRLPRLVLSPGARRALETASWPGNVRQLEHAVEAALIRAAGEGATQIEASHCFPGGRASAVAAAADDAAASFQEATRRFQVDLLRRTLESTGWNVMEAARRLDLARSHVYNLIKAFGLARDDA